MGSVNEHEKRKNYLTDEEVKKLMAASKNTRYSLRNKLIVLLMYRHGLRVTELVSLRTEDVNIEEARLWVKRLKGGLSVTHHISGDELRMLRKYYRERNSKLTWLFINERGDPMTRQSINYIIRIMSAKADLPHVNPHMLRHSCGFSLADRNFSLRVIQDYLGHRDPKHTVLYTRTNSERFKNLWT